MAGLYINIMKKYNFYKFEVELNPDTIIIETDGIVLHPDRLTIDVNIVYEGKHKRDMQILYEVPVLNMNFEVNSLNKRVLIALKNFEIIESPSSRQSINNGIGNSNVDETKISDHQLLKLPWYTILINWVKNIFKC